MTSVIPKIKSPLPDRALIYSNRHGGWNATFCGLTPLDRLLLEHCLKRFGKAMPDKVDAEILVDVFETVLPRARQINVGPTTKLDLSDFDHLDDDLDPATI